MERCISVYALILTKDAPFTAARYKLCLGRQIYYISASLQSVCTVDIGGKLLEND